MQIALLIVNYRTASGIPSIAFIIYIRKEKPKYCIIAISLSSKDIVEMLKKKFKIVVT
jgi:predicted phosphoribosyltransferase